MPEALLTTNISVAGGPSLAFKQTITAADCYDVLQIAVPAGTSAADPVTAQLQPAQGMQLLAIVPATCSDQLTCSVPADPGAPPGSPAPASFPLDQPQLFTGGAFKAFGAAQPTTLLFTNASADDVTIQILVLRDATPE